ncbi:hypothetical protein evm_006927 [Chilo suppressalis]|nr:hypothetical protein evm_006927 [Chilo suppressalis]
MEKKTRLRSPNFTSIDNLLLCELLNKYKHFIEIKKCDGATLLQKQKAWKEVTKEFNAATTGPLRTRESLQQNYKNLKKKAKRTTSSDNKTDIPDGGLPLKLEDDPLAIQNITPQEEINSSDTSDIVQEPQDEIININEGKRKIYKKHTFSDKFKILASKKIEYIEMQKELLQIQLIDAKEKLEHDRLLRSMELEDIKANYEHETKIRKIELDQLTNKISRNYEEFYFELN